MDSVLKNDYYYSNIDINIRMDRQACPRGSQPGEIYHNDFGGNYEKY